MYMWSITIGSGIYLARGMCNVMGMGYSHTQIYTHTYIRIYIHTYMYVYMFMDISKRHELVDYFSG
jgi:hypothetical protein